MGGSSGGGSTSGRVDFPNYMKSLHETWLTEIGLIINVSTTGANPYRDVIAFDPSARLVVNSEALLAFITAIDALNPQADWNSAYTTVEAQIADLPDVAINIQEQVDAYADIVDNDLTTRQLPILNRSLQNVGANLSSAFTIGEAILTNERNRAVNKFTQDITLKAIDVQLQLAQLQAERERTIQSAVTTIFQGIQQKVEFYKMRTHYTAELNRIDIVAHQEEIQTNLQYRVLDAKWSLEWYQAGANMMASISGATVSKGVEGVGWGQSALGGALSGAAAGAMVAGTPGAIVGGLIGGIGGALS